MLRCWHLGQFTQKPLDPYRHTATIDLELSFTGSPYADAAALPRQVRPHASQAREQVLQLQIDLQLDVLRFRPLRVRTHSFRILEANASTIRSGAQEWPALFR